MKAATPGANVSDVAAQIRSQFEEAGWEPEKYFIHALGHGVGLNVHEQPRISTDSDAILEQGMTITMEPGLYVPGVGGIRVEDTIVVGEEPELLTEWERQLIPS